MAAEPAACVDLSLETEVDPKTGVPYLALASFGAGGVQCLAEGSIQEALGRASVCALA